MSQAQHRTPVALDGSIRIERFGEIDSTSAHARAEIARGRLSLAPVAFVAASQRSGVGRFGRAWVSPEGGLWMTLAWPCPDADLNELLDGLGLRLGVGCLRTIQRALEADRDALPVRLKWPNDVLVGGRKVLGILTEVVHGAAGSAPWILVGVGVNANVQPEALPQAVREHSTTLMGELHRRVDLVALETDLLAELRTALAGKGVSRELLMEASAALHGLDRDTNVSLPDGSRISGVLTGLNEHGMAVLNIEGRVFVPPLGSVIMLGAAGTAG